MSAQNSKRKSMPSLRRVWNSLSPLFSDAKGRIISLSVTSFLGGLAEAMVLVLVVRVALAISEGETSVEAAVGPLELEFTTGWMLGFAAALVVVRVLLQGYAALVSARMSADVLGSLRTGVLRDYLRAPWAVQSLEEEGHVHDLASRHAGRAANAVVFFTNGLNAFFNFVALLISAVIVSPVSALVVIVVVSLLYVVLRPLGKATRRAASAQSDIGRKYAKSVLELLGLTLETRIHNVTDPVLDSVDDLVRSEMRWWFRGQFYAKLLTPLYSSVALLVLLGGLALVSTVGANLASLGAIVLILLRSMNYASSLQAVIQHTQEVLPFSERLQRERRRFRRATTEPGTLSCGALDLLEFDHVSFQYRNDELALVDVSFSVRAGESIGIIGPSGAGKSTLIQILLNLRQPTAGRFLINGIEATALSPESWYDQLAVVPQDSRMLSASVKDNIRFFRASVTDEDIKRAARQAHIHDDIMSWPDEYDTMVGPRGNAVSGGQRQRLSLARALAGDPKVLVLDEPTSALDGESERLVQDSLVALRGNVTMFLVAHRLSTLNICDRIMVLGKGRLQAFDERSELEAGNEYYRQAVALSQVR